MSVCCQDNSYPTCISILENSAPEYTYVGALKQGTLARPCWLVVTQTHENPISYSLICKTMLCWGTQMKKSFPESVTAWNTGTVSPGNRSAPSLTKFQQCSDIIGHMVYLLGMVLGTRPGVEFVDPCGSFRTQHILQFCDSVTVRDSSVGREKRKFKKSCLPL